MKRRGKSFTRSGLKNLDNLTFATQGLILQAMVHFTNYACNHRAVWDPPGDHNMGRRQSVTCWLLSLQADLTLFSATEEQRG